MGDKGGNLINQNFGKVKIPTEYRTLLGQFGLVQIKIIWVIIFGFNNKMNIELKTEKGRDAVQC